LASNDHFFDFDVFHHDQLDYGGEEVRDILALADHGQQSLHPLQPVKWKGRKVGTWVGKGKREVRKEAGNNKEEGRGGGGEREREGK
jgi:hypothetical protein